MKPRFTIPPKLRQPLDEFIAKYTTRLFDDGIQRGAGSELKKSALEQAIDELKILLIDQTPETKLAVYNEAAGYNHEFNVNVLEEGYVFFKCLSKSGQHIYLANEIEDEQQIAKQTVIEKEIQESKQQNSTKKVIGAGIPAATLAGHTMVAMPPASASTLSSSLSSSLSLSATSSTAQSTTSSAASSAASSTSSMTAALSTLSLAATSSNSSAASSSVSSTSSVSSVVSTPAATSKPVSPRKNPVNQQWLDKVQAAAAAAATFYTRSTNTSSSMPSSSSASSTSSSSSVSPFSSASSSAPTSSSAYSSASQPITLSSLMAQGATAVGNALGVTAMSKHIADAKKIEQEQDDALDGSDDESNNKPRSGFKKQG